MSPRYVVVDGSNIATEGRSIPSLAQLDEAVRAFMVERPSEQVIVVVDASFGYRIDESERSEYEQAEAAGEIVSPPAGALGRGDGFLLRIADRTDAVVLSNDSFQEFHAEYPWLFDTGRLMGGKPVPAVGWIFTPRAPVRGPRSREAIRAAKKAEKAALKRATVAEGPVAMAIAEATAEAISPGEVPPASGIDDDDEGGDASRAGRGGRGRRRHTKPVGSVNDPLPFIQFIADHPLGSEVEGEVDGFTSHGAFVQAAGARCYVPLVALGDPPPRSAKTVLKRGEVRQFVVQALDPPRRGIELALPGMERVAGTPTEETVEADIGAGRMPRKAAVTPGVEVPAGGEVPAAPSAPKRSGRKRAAAAAEATPVVAVEPAEPAPARARRSRKAPAVVAGVGAEPAGDPDGLGAEAAATGRRGRARKAAVAAPVEDRTTSVAPEPAVPEPVAPEPVARGRGRARKAVAAPAEAAVPSAPGAGGAGEPAAPAPAGPRRSRVPKAAETEPAAAPVPSSRGRAKKAAPAAEPVAAPAGRSRKVAAAAAPGAEPEAPRRARTAKKAAEPAPGEPTPPKKTARKRAVPTSDAGTAAAAPADAAVKKSRRPRAG